MTETGDRGETEMLTRPLSQVPGNATRETASTQDALY